MQSKQPKLFTHFEENPPDQKTSPNCPHFTDYWPAGKIRQAVQSDSRTKFSPGLTTKAKNPNNRPVSTDMGLRNKEKGSMSHE
jgi:hypothetical protein